MLHLVHTFSINNIFFDLINYTFLSFIFFYFYKNKYIEKNKFYTLLIVSLGPFIINGLLIDWWFMPDQAKYFQYSNNLRNFEMQERTKLSVMFPSIIYSFTPLPFIETIKSIGFINKLLLGISTIYFYKYKKVNNFFFYFINLCPSVFIYSSLSLKDTLSLIYILSLAISFIYYRGYLLNITLILLYAIIKPVNTCIFIIVFYFYNLFIVKRFIILNLITLFLTLILFMFYYEILFQYFNKLRLNLFVEAYTFSENFQKIELSFIGIITIFKGIINFIISPMQNINSSFKMFQSLENICLYFLIIYFFLKTLKVNKKAAIFWVISFIFVFIIYGNLFYSDGAIARYRYVLLLFYAFIFYSEINYAKKN